MKLKPVLILAVLPIVLLTSRADSEPPKASRSTLQTRVAASTLQTRVAATLEQFREDYGFPGATAAYVLRDGRRGNVGVGLADIESRKEMTAETPMLAASIGKSFPRPLSPKRGEGSQYLCAMTCVDTNALWESEMPKLFPNAP